MTATAQRVADWVARTLSYECRDPALFVAALTHRSFGGRHNERLEFLGDAVLSLAVARWLYESYPDADEGTLSRYRAHLVNGETLADLAEGLGVGDRLLLGGGELKSGGFRRRSILADALEALIGALYLDGGPEPARRLIVDLLATRHAGLPALESVKDAKSLLQEWLQGRSLPLPAYTVEEVGGEPPDQVFRVRASIASLDVEREATGTSRRRAEQAAAEAVLAAVRGLR